MDWPYDDQETPETTPAPAWGCPENLCQCAAPTGEGDEVEFSVMLLLPTGERMPGAICRIQHQGRVINEDQPKADAAGWVTAKIPHAPTTVFIEWAPANAPKTPGYPFCCRYYVDLGETREDAGRRRLSNLDVPIVSGTVSLYDETDGKAILPTPNVAAVGLVANASDVVSSTFPKAGLSVLLLGAETEGPLGGSEWMSRSTGEVKGPPPTIDLALESRLQKLMLNLLRSRPRPIESAHDVSDGGLAVALVEACVGGDPGTDVGLEATLPPGGATAAKLFAEGPSRIIVSVEPEQVSLIESQAKAANVPVRFLGTTVGDRLVLKDEGAVVVEGAPAELRAARGGCLRGIWGGDCGDG